MIALESFEAKRVEERQDPEAYQKGYDAGLAAGIAQEQARTNALSETLVEQISAITFSYAEARGQVLTALRPLLAEIVEKILPHCVETGFAGQLVDVMAQAAEADLGETVTLHVHPDQQQQIRQALGGTDTLCHVATDPTLSLHAAWISAGSGEETMLDTDALLAALTQTLSILLTPQEKAHAHGK